MKTRFFVGIIAAFFAILSNAKEFSVRVTGSHVVSVKTEDLTVDKFKEQLVFPVLVVLDNPALDAKSNARFSAIRARIRLNCQSGSGEVFLKESFVGRDALSDKVLSNNSVTSLVGGKGAYLPEGLGYLICVEARAMGLVSSVNRVFEPELIPGGERPSSLDLKVIQTRKYEASLTDFFKAFEELCRNGAGTYSPARYSSKSGALKCWSVKLQTFQKFPSGRGGIEIEIESDDSSLLITRLRIEAAQEPVYNRWVYSAVFKEISDLLGLIDIPIDARLAE